VGDAARALERLVEQELGRPAPASAALLAGRIRERLGSAAAAVVFYGSCLRRQSDEGVLDFYALVDDYAGAYSRRALALANATLPPNVFYLEMASGDRTLRAKYAVLSARDFERGTAGGLLRPGIWARFCQPLLAVWVRDEAALGRLAQGGARAVLTALEQVLPLLPEEDGIRRFSARTLWQTAFRETYGYEMRPESPEAAAALYGADAARFDRAAELGLAALAEGGRLALERDAGGFGVRLPREGAARARRRWRRRRPLAKAAYLIALGKTTLTFGDWLPYALWKLERHTGARLEPSPRQRRHPLIFGWPLLARALWRRDLR